MKSRLLIEQRRHPALVTGILLDDIEADIEQAVDDTDTQPTDEEKENDSYDKGEFEWNGLTIAIENPKGSTRSGQDKDGNEWSVTMPAHYGEFIGVHSKDKDPLDVYMGDMPESDLVFVVNQRKKDSDVFDEHKVMCGFQDEQSAINAYDAAFNDGLGPKLRKSVIEVRVDDLIDWMDNGDTKKEFTDEWSKP